MSVQFINTYGMTTIPFVHYFFEKENGTISEFHNLSSGIQEKTKRLIRACILCNDSEMYDSIFKEIYFTFFEHGTLLFNDCAVAASPYFLSKSDDKTRWTSTIIEFKKSLKEMIKNEIFTLPEKLNRYSREFILKNGSERKFWLDKILNYMDNDIFYSKNTLIYYGGYLFGRPLAFEHMFIGPLVSGNVFFYSIHDF